MSATSPTPWSGVVAIGRRYQSAAAHLLPAWEATAMHWGLLDALLLRPDARFWITAVLVWPTAYYFLSVSIAGL